MQNRHIKTSPSIFPNNLSCGVLNNNVRIYLDEYFERNIKAEILSKDSQKT
jgi:hypothetical protein